jgi:hypothetical protein
MDRRVGHRVVGLPIDQPDGDAGSAQTLHCGKQRAIQFLGHRSFDADPTLPRQMTVEQDVHVHAAVPGVDQGVDDAVAVLAQQVADEKQRQLDRMFGAVDLRQDGMVRAVIPAVEQGLPAKGVEQVERAQRIDAVASG